MTVDEVYEQAEVLNGESLTIDGFLLVMRENDDFLCWISPKDENPQDDLAIPLAHSLADLKKIITPLPTMELLYRGDFIHPPYYYRFPLELTATLQVDETGALGLHDITHVRVAVPHPGKLAEIIDIGQYSYQANLDYHKDAEYRAQIHSQRIIHINKTASESIILTADEGRYARSLLHHTVTIPGMLSYVTSHDGKHFILRTYAVRHSMVGIGILKAETLIWWRPDERYTLLRAHLPLATDINYRVAITGEIEYLYTREGIPLADNDELPQLVFKRLDAITVYAESILL